MAVPTPFPGAIVAALRQRHRPSDGTAHSAAALSERVRNRCRCAPHVHSSHRYAVRLCAGHALQPPTHVSAPFIILAVPLQRLLNSGRAIALVAAHVDIRGVCVAVYSLMYSEKRLNLEKSPTISDREPGLFS